MRTEYNFEKKKIGRGGKGELIILTRGAKPKFQMNLNQNLA